MHVSASSTFLPHHVLSLCKKFSNMLGRQTRPTKVGFISSPKISKLGFFSYYINISNVKHICIHFFKDFLYRSRQQLVHICISRTWTNQQWIQLSNVSNINDERPIGEACTSLKLLLPIISNECEALTYTKFYYIVIYLKKNLNKKVKGS